MTGTYAKNGIFGLFSLDGAPVDPRDRIILFGDGADDAASSSAPGALVAAGDRATGALHRHDDGTTLAVLLGDLDEPAALAVQLDLPPGANQAALAAAAHVRWGPGAPARLAGEWLLLVWHAPSATLTLLTAEGTHEHCYVATDGRRVAVAPSLARLARLPWVDARFDPDMLMRTMGRGHLRTSVGARTILTGAMRLRAGAGATIDAHGIRTAAADASPPPDARAIEFDDAVAELDALLRRVVRQRTLRARGIAVEMSGGLDSSLLGLLVAQERRHDQQVVFLTSAAPSGSGMADESDWAGIVARHLGVPLVEVTPAMKADVYCPSARTFAAAESPALSPRHYLYEALGDAAVAAGAQLLVDGSFGEQTISNHGHCLDTQRRVSPRALLRDLRDTWRLRTEPTRTADYHVMPARGALAALADPRALRPRSYAERRLADDAPFGFENGFDRVGLLPTTTGDPRVRTLLPLRDPRLLRLMAGYPAEFLRHAGVDRAPIRALLAGRLPESVVTRPKGLAFSPTYTVMLRDQAGAAIARISEQRRAGAGEWLDLAWLERTLGRMQRGEHLPPQTVIRVQGTAYAAAFFDWWQQAVRRA